MGNNKDSLGDRCKQYERNSEHHFIRKVPIILRCDGRAFHTYTKGCDKPFDQDLIDAMFASARNVAIEMQGCLACYVQSDEATFVLSDDDDVDTQQWFKGRQNKIESVTAGLMTAHFNNLLTGSHKFGNKVAVFDARAFQCPKEDVANVFLWRMKDWERNSISMYCLNFFTSKQLHGKGRADQHEMLHKIGKNWATDCTAQQKNGSWWSANAITFMMPCKYDNIHEFIFNKS